MFFGTFIKKVCAVIKPYILAVGKIAELPEDVAEYSVLFCKALKAFNFEQINPAVKDCAQGYRNYFYWNNQRTGNCNDCNYTNNYRRIIYDIKKLIKDSINISAVPAHSFFGFVQLVKHSRIFCMLIINFGSMLIYLYFKIKIKPFVIKILDSSGKVLNYICKKLGK